MPAVCVISPKTYGYGALLIAGILENANTEVTVSKQFVVGECLDKDVIGISLHSISDVLEYSNTIRKLKNETGAHIIIGGSASVMPEIIFQYVPWTDSVVVGEGEDTIVEAMKNLEDKQSLDEVRGVAFVSDGSLTKTEKRKPTSLEGRPKIKIPADLHSQCVRGSNIYLETHRGCTQNCTFCLVPRLFGNFIRSRPIKEVVDEAKALKSAGASRIAISGGTASLYGYEEGTLNERAFSTLLSKLCRVLGKSNLTAADLRVDMVTPEILESLKKFTSGHVAFGIESGSEKTLRSLCKGFDISEVHEAVRMTKEAGLKITGSFITGLPFEEESDYEATRSLIRSLRLYNYAINIAEPIPGTPLFNQMLRLDLGKNPLFRTIEGKEGIHSLTVAEYRALHLWLDAYETKYKKKCPKRVLHGFISRVEQENKRIAKVIKACSFLNK